VLSSPCDAEAHLAAFFARPEVAFVLARFPTYGCYGLRLERAQTRVRSPIASKFAKANFDAMGDLTLVYWAAWSLVAAS